MPFRIIRDNITHVKADAIVNSANPQPMAGGGAEGDIFRAAGPRLDRARARLGTLETGAAAVTKAYGLNAKYVIHTIGPVWQGGGMGEREALRRCYRNSIDTAISLGCESVAFPLISSGNYGFPKPEALSIAIEEIRSRLFEDIEMILVVYDRESYALSSERYAGVRAYIDDKYVDERGLRRNRPQFESLEATRPITGFDFPASEVMSDSMPDFAPMPKAAPKPSIFGRLKPKADLASRMRELDAGFSESLLRLIDESGCTDAEIYKRANVDRKLFSKIRSKPDYRPSKSTALAFCVALRLDPAAARELIGRAGYALSRSSYFDIIVEYFLETGNYDICEINATLFEFDQPLLGSA